MKVRCSCEKMNSSHEIRVLGRACQMNMIYGGEANLSFPCDVSLYEYKLDVGLDVTSTIRYHVGGGTSGIGRVQARPAVGPQAVVIVKRLYDPPITSHHPMVARLTRTSIPPDGRKVPRISLLPRQPAILEPLQ